MALADYTDEDGYADPARLFNDVAAIGIIPGDKGKGRSDEYLHYLEYIRMPNGYVEVVLFLRLDDWDDKQDDVSSFVNIEVAVGVNVVTPEQLTRGKVEQALNGGTSMLGSPDVADILFDGDYDSRLPKDEFIPLIEAVRLDFMGGDRIELVGDDMWNPKELANVFAYDMQWYIDEAIAEYESVSQILNG